MQEIRESVVQFAGKLALEDPCAFLVLVCHGHDIGGQHILLGSDGKHVHVGEILQQFDRNVCIKMADKPKIIVVQAYHQGKVFTHVLNSD